MPKITQRHEINITPERFLEACSNLELIELDLLIQSPRFQNKIKGVNHPGNANKPMQVVSTTFNHKNKNLKE